MSALKCQTETACQSPGQTLAGASGRRATKPEESPRSGGSLPGQTVYARSVNTKAETKRRRPFYPRTPNAQGMVAGIAIHALENGWLELLAKQACEN